MGRNSSNHSHSPIRSRRERSPAQQKSSHRDISPVREKRSSRAKSPKREMSLSPPPARHKSSHRDLSPVRERRSGRAKSPKRETSLSPPPPREKNPIRAKSPKRENSPSPSPRTKRLHRTQAEREDEIVGERDRERSHHHRKGDDKVTRREREVEELTERERDRRNGRGTDKNAHRERGADRENGAERKERRSGRDAIDEKSSRARNGRSRSPSDQHRSRHRSRSPRRDADRRERDEVTNSRGSEQRNEDDDSLAKMKAAEEALETKQKHQPSFELSGKLAAETNRVRGVTLLFNEPPEACKPEIRWRLYVFKAGEVLDEPLKIYRQSCYLFGRERRVSDIPTDHPSCSKQHAVLQFRRVEKEQPDGTLSNQVRPYIMDLGSTNKTFINDNPIEPQRYYELFEKDTIKFGNSSREYVLLHEDSTT